MRSNSKICARARVCVREICDYAFDYTYIRRLLQYKTLKMSDCKLNK